MVLLDRYLDQVKNLPPAPTVAVQLLGLFSDPDRDIDRIVELIAHDPSLTTETLHRCNDGCLTGSAPAEDMFEAVTRLGLYEIYSIVVGLMASRTMTQVRAEYRWDANRLWQHTVLTAVISSALAKRVQVAEATAFTAGLLHDIGKLVLVSMEGIVYADMVRTAGFFGPSLAATETACFGFTHAALGARLLARWGLPDGLRLAVELHHQSPATASEHLRLAAVVNFANSLAHQMADGPAGAPTAAEASSEAMELVELTDKDIPALVLQISLDLQRVHGLLHLHA
jgi:putative nucleotidyltransferase with HDIG domain